MTSETYQIRLLQEKKRTEPVEGGPGTRFRTLELWFSNIENASPQHVYLSIHRDKFSDDISHSNHALDVFNHNDQSSTSTITTVLTEHLTKLAESQPSLNLPNHHRFGFKLVGDNFSTIIAPPLISESALISDPQLPKIPYHTLKFLEAREIRPNIRICKTPPPSDDGNTQHQKCIYKAVNFAREAYSLSFEITNYKRLVAHSPEMERWLVNIVGLVYIDDIEKPDQSSATAPVPTPQEDNETAIDDSDPMDTATPSVLANNTQFIGALFTYHPQRDLTAHYTADIPVDIKTSWLRQLLAAISALESAGFEHWDLKCENIVLDTGDGLPEDDFTSHMVASTSPDIIIQRETIEKNRAERRSSTTTRPSLINPGKIKIIDLENSKASAPFRPLPRGYVESSGSVAGSPTAERRGSVGGPDQHPEWSISMVYAMGKSVLEMFTGKVPEIGDPLEEEMVGLTEAAKCVVEMACLLNEGGERNRAAEIRRVVEERFFKQFGVDEDHDLI